MAVEKIILDIQAKVGKAKKDINSLKTGTKSLNKEVNKTSALLKKAGTAMLAFASIGMITRAIKDMIALNMEFEKTLTNVLTLLDKTSKAKFGDFLSAGALRTMSQFGLEVNDVNKALFDTISAGIKAGNSIRFLTEASKLAVGGVTTLSIAVDGMTSIMNAYALSIGDANKVASAFFTAQKHGKTTVAELAQNVGMLAPTMKMAGIGFQEMLAGMALLTKQGISTDMATTALRATIIALTKTTPETAKIFKQLGIETGIVAIKTNGFMETLMQVAKAAQENEDILTQVIQSVRALTAVAAMGEDALILYAEILEDVTTNYGEGSDAAAAFELQMSTWTKRVDMAKGAWGEFRIELGQSGEFEAVRRNLTLVTGLLMLMSDRMRENREERNKIAEWEEITGEKQTRRNRKQIKEAQEEAEKREHILSERRLAAIEDAKRRKALREKDEKDERKKPELPEDVLTERIFGEDELVTLRDDFLLYMDVLGQMSDDIVSNEEETQIKIADIKDKFKEEDKERAAKEIEIQNLKFGTILALASNTFFAASAFAKKGSTLQKTLAIADTLIATYASATLAFKSQAGIPVVGPGLGIAAGISAIVMGLANVATISGIGFKEGGFTGSDDIRLRDKDGPITGWTHKDEFVFTKEKTKILRPLFEDIHYNRIDIRGLAALTRRGMMQAMPKLNADILENEVKKIYRKISEQQTEKPTFVYYDHGYTKKIGNITINVSN